MRPRASCAPSTPAPAGCGGAGTRCRPRSRPAWPTQPFPAPALRLAPESLAAADAFGATPEARRQCRDRIAALRYDGVFTPPSLRGTILFPGDIGGMNWSGVAVDERRGVLIAP